MTYPSTVQIGNYQITAELGSGTFGRVYLGVHTLLPERVVAMKVMHATCLGSQMAEDAFLQEARFLEVLTHPHILPLLDVGYVERLPYLVTAYAPHGSLKDHLLHCSPFCEREALSILVQIGQALHYVHQHHVIHRDLKPANILLGRNGDVLLADFGIALREETTAEYIEPTGTPAYMAPEQFRGRVSRHSDQYALGCIAYELFTGRRPFVDSNVIALGLKHCMEQPLPPTFYNPSLSKQREHAILKAMAKQPRDRHVDVAAFISALLGFTMSEPERSLVRR